MPRTICPTPPPAARRKSNAQRSQERVEAEVADVIRSAKTHRNQLANLIMKMRGEGLHWDNIGKAIGLPGYCCMVIARETRAHRQTPQR